MAGRALTIAFVTLAAVVAAGVIVGFSTTGAQDAVASLDHLRVREVLFLDDQDIYLVYNDGDPMALSADAQHLGDRVEFCESSQMFESPAHGEKFDIEGNYYAGPARRGLDRYPVRVKGDGVYVDLEQQIQGPQRGEPRAREPQGEFCV